MGIIEYESNMFLPQRSKQESHHRLALPVSVKSTDFVQTVNGTMEQGSVAVVLDGHLDSRPGFGSWFSCQFFTFFPRELAVAMENTWQRTKALRLILGDLATRNAAIARGGERHGRTCGRWRCCGRDETSAGWNWIWGEPSSSRNNEKI